MYEKIVDMHIIQQIISERPEPIFTHTSSAAASSARIIKTLSESVTFGPKPQTFGWGDVTITLSPAIGTDTTFSVNGTIIPAVMENASVRNHIIALTHAGVQCKIAEHILGALTMTWHIAHVSLEWGTSWPTESRCIEEYVAAIREKSVGTTMKADLITPIQPFMLRAPNGAYIGMLPDDGSEKLTLDIMIAYPWTSIGTQRICVDVDDELATIVGAARPPAFGRRNTLVSLLHRIPHTKNIINIDPDHVIRATQDALINPRPEFFHNGHYLEFILHQTTDKGWAVWLSPDRKRGVGTMFAFKASHADDLACVDELLRGYTVIPQRAEND